MGKFKYVSIPCDSSAPIEELEITYKDGDEVMCLINKLKLHFRKDSLSSQGQEALRQKLLSELPQGVQMPEGLVDVGMDMQLVESVALVPHIKDTKYTGVNMYIDDRGQHKNLPVNMRATDITMKCGAPTEVRGDAFLARVFDNEDDFKRLDFTAADLSSSAAWMREAQEYNRRKQHMGNPQEMMSRLTEGQAASTSKLPPPPVTPAAQAKEKGNAAFKAGKYEEAVACYSQGLELDPALTVLYGNRAMALLKLERFAEAEADCSKALQLDPDNVKVLLRRGTALRAQGRVEAARMDWEAVLALQPQNAEAHGLLQRLQAGEAGPEGAQ